MTGGKPKLKTTFRAEYRKWRKDWDALCNRCGKCCYTRMPSLSGIRYSDPCVFLDLQTNLCRVYENRFREYSYCGKVNLFHALFNPFMPPDCAYVKTFRRWRR